MNNKEQRERENYKQIANKLPFIQGTIILENGERVDIADIFKVPKTDIDPQIRKAQSFYPFLRDTVILENGRTCSLMALFNSLLSMIREAGVVYTDELRLTTVEVTDEMFEGGIL